MPAVQIRLATPADLDRLVEGNRAMARETEQLELDAETLEAGVRGVFIHPTRGRYYVAEIDRVPIGQLMITYEWSDWRNAHVWWVQSVYVWPSHRGRGVYRALYGHVRKQAEAVGAAGLRLYVDLRNRDAQEVYARLGMDGEHYAVFEDMI